jgi:acetoin utilization deacetylase AcuC-like enzyme
VFTLSLHGEKNFPFRKEASDLDVDLPDGCGDDDYLHALETGAGRAGPPRFEPGWSSTWPAPTRTRATAWGA